MKRKMCSYEDDRPRQTPEYLKNLSPEQLHAHTEKLLKKYEKKQINKTNTAHA